MSDLFKDSDIYKIFMYISVNKVANAYDIYI